MKAKLLISSLLLGTAILAIAKVEDPVLMTINGKDVRLSEFEYLYHKNNQQQLEKETLEQYVDRFILYKQKVADAEAAGIDTTELFRREYEGYENDLAAPYVVEDTTYKWHFIEEAYERSKKEIDVDHILLPPGNTPQAMAATFALMDSIRNCALNGEKWEDLADQFSSDASKTRYHGRYGYITACMYPYDFESVVYSTPVGEISKPFRTQYGVHIVRVNGIRDREDARASHILKLFPKGATEEQKAQVKASIDSIYTLLQNGANFEELAKVESQDPGSAQRGGDLGWFRRGRMIKPFEDVVYSLPDGAISEPFVTQYGYHIVKKVAHGLPEFSVMRQYLENAISHDERASMIQEHHLNDLKAKCGFAANPNLDSYLTKALNDNGGNIDSTFVTQVIKDSKVPLFTYGKNLTANLSELYALINPKAKLPNAVSAKDYIVSEVNTVAEKTLGDYYARQQVQNNPEYRHLLNEYRDGMLLFEISNRRVWKAAGKDTLGLERYFAEHRAKYRWDEPYFKGIILSAKNDSVLDLVKADIKGLSSDEITDAVTEALHNKYGDAILMERMVFKKGENVLADYLAFNEGEKPQRPKYSAFMILQGGLIDQPEEMNDVRGNVTSDYQDVLEERWRQELQAKYPAKVNKKVLKKVK